MNYIARTVEDTIKKSMFKGKAIVLYGPRQVGKTTLAHRLLESFPDKKIARYTCDDQRQAALFTPDITALRRVVEDNELIFIDEAQYIKNTGLVLKLLVDTFPDVQVVATGSSTFDLSDKIKEAMTGRVFSYTLLPFAASEVAISTVDHVTFDLERALQIGMYPDVYRRNDEDAKRLLNEIATSYLYKDLLSTVTLRQESLLGRLLKALALQVGQEVSYNELANLLEVNRATIERYIYLLEQTFVIFRLDPLSGNHRKTVSTRKRKVYFYDLGIRSVLAGQLDIPPTSNPVLGSLFENFCILERMKQQLSTDQRVNRYYWRSFDSEIDYVEQSGTATDAFEFKWNRTTTRRIPTFHKQHPNATLSVIHNANYWDFIS
jgi:hypothetical protein